MSSLIICNKQKKIYLSSLGVKEGVAKDIQYVKKLPSQLLKGRKHLEDLDINGRVVIKSFLKTIYSR